MQTANTKKQNSQTLRPARVSLHNLPTKEQNGSAWAIYETHIRTRYDITPFAEYYRYDAVLGRRHRLVGHHV